jgi:hypothetical protein
LFDKKGWPLDRDGKRFLHGDHKVVHEACGNKWYALRRVAVYVPANGIGFRVR